jgi:predicted nucleic acid-binding protein
MRFAADSSILVRLYLRDTHTDRIEQCLTDEAKVLSVSEPARVEVLNVLLRREGRASRSLADLEEGIRFRSEPIDWHQAFHQAESLARRFSTALKPGGHDLILVAAAVTADATWFLSLDRNSKQRSLRKVLLSWVWQFLSDMTVGRKSMEVWSRQDNRLLITGSGR